MPVLVAEATEARNRRIEEQGGWREGDGASARQPIDTTGTIALRGSTLNGPYHEPALVESVVAFLAPRPGAVIADATCGTGGHCLAILPRLLPNGRLIAIDRDAEALAAAKRRMADDEPQLAFMHGNFRELPTILHQLAIARLDGLLLDLGMSSVQVDCAERGFSFLKEGPLDMRMDVRQATSAATLVNKLPADELAQLFATFGEERFARRIARQIAIERRKQPITTTTQLAQIVARAVPSRSAHGRLHPATRTFQALRIAVNDELGALSALLDALPGMLAPKGRAVILAFHSLEDRMVKEAFASGDRDGVWTKLTKKPIRPSAEEVSRNPRARSVRLRAVEKHSCR